MLLLLVLFVRDCVCFFLLSLFLSVLIAHEHILLVDLLLRVQHPHPHRRFRHILLGHWPTPLLLLFLAQQEIVSHPLLVRFLLDFCIGRVPLESFLLAQVSLRDAPFAQFPGESVQFDLGDDLENHLLELAVQVDDHEHQVDEHVQAECADDAPGYDGALRGRVVEDEARVQREAHEYGRFVYNEQEVQFASFEGTHLGQIQQCDQTLRDTQDQLKDGPRVEHDQDGCVGVATEQEQGTPHLVDGLVHHDLRGLNQRLISGVELLRVQHVEVLHDNRVREYGEQCH